jgi:TonB family protein
MLVVWIAVLAFVAPVAAQSQPVAKERNLVRKVEPDYPETLKRLYIGGIVKLEVTITSAGTVQEVKLLGGNPALGQSAMAAVKRWKYAPAGSKSITQVTLTFDPHK